jgi:hypothetical protein
VLQMPLFSYVLYDFLTQTRCQIDTNIKISTHDLGDASGTHGVIFDFVLEIILVMLC